jgi:hypothetical protein
MASRVVSQLWPTLMPSTSLRRMSFRIKSGVKPLSFEASVTEISSGARSFKGAILVSAVPVMAYGREREQCSHYIRSELEGKGNMTVS